MFKPYSLAVTLAAFAVAIPAHAGLEDWCKKLTPRLPGVSLKECTSTDLQPSGARSVKGFPILEKNFPASHNSKQPIRILLLGGIHGDELTASSIVFDWMGYLQKSPTPKLDWKILPVVNPDGLLASKPSRVNARGVDLNRNFPTPDWDHEAQHYWKVKTGKDPRRFPGKTPLSEPESRWVNFTIEHYRPDVVISIHAPFGILDLDGPVKPPTRFGRIFYKQIGVYPGSLGKYGSMTRNVPIVTIELPNAQAMPKSADVQRIWSDMLNWIQNNVKSQAILAKANSKERINH